MESWAWLAREFRTDPFPNRGQGQGPIGFNIEDIFQLGDHSRADPENLPVLASETEMPTGVYTHVSALAPEIMLAIGNHVIS